MQAACSFRDVRSTGPCRSLPSQYHPKMTQYHQVLSNTDQYWPSTTKYWPVLPNSWQCRQQAPSVTFHSTGPCRILPSQGITTVAHLLTPDTRAARLIVTGHTTTSPIRFQIPTIWLQHFWWVASPDHRSNVPKKPLKNSATKLLIQWQWFNQKNCWKTKTTWQKLWTNALAK